MHFFTIASSNYLAHAKVLAKSIKKFNNDAAFHLILISKTPIQEEQNTEDKIFDYIWKAEEAIPKEKQNLFFIYDALELSCLLKPLGALYILNKNPKIKTLVYLDSDIEAFSSLSFIEDELKDHSILLTPHLLKPNHERNEIVFHEFSMMKTGIYNAGFFAVKNDSEGNSFLSWWSDRLKEFGEVDHPRGLYTDQKWLDFAPSFFPNIKLLRDPGSNVATWNLSEREVSKTENGEWIINNRYPLKFFHFSGFDSGAHRAVLARYVKPNHPLWELSILHEQNLNKNEHQKLKKYGYPYASYTNKTKISPIERRLYKEDENLQKKFIDPFSDECQKWMHSHIHHTLRSPLTQISIRSLTFHYLVFKVLSTISIGNLQKTSKLNKEICKHLLKNAAQGSSISW